MIRKLAENFGASNKKFCEEIIRLTKAENAKNMYSNYMSLWVLTEKNVKLPQQIEKV